jgi:citrate/tricarballylate utilization protein
VSLITALCLAFALIAAALFIDPDTLFSTQTEPGAFYRIVSHNVMLSIGGGTFTFALLAMAMGGLKFWRASGMGWPVLARLKNWRHALTAAATLEHLGGGHGEGCNTDSAAFSNQRRYFHQFTMWGFLLCFAATCTATVYEYALDRLSPFPLLSLPVILGTIGGIGLLIGPVGLLLIKLKSDDMPLLVRSYGMDVALLAMLFLISLTGLILLALRETSAMGILLMVHLGFVLAFFVTMPYSKFVHGIYRLAALLRYADETTDK